MQADLRFTIEDLRVGEEVSLVVGERETDSHKHCHPEHHHRRERTLGWQLGPFDEETPSDQEGPPDMSFTLKDNQSVSFGVSGKDAAGNDAPLTGTPQFAVDDSSILTLTDNGDGSGTVAAAGKIGTATLSVTDSETNGKQFIGSVAIDVVAGDVASVAVTLGQPTDAPAPSAPTEPDVPTEPVTPEGPGTTDPGTSTPDVPTGDTPDVPTTDTGTTPSDPNAPTAL